MILNARMCMKTRLTEMVRELRRFTELEIHTVSNFSSGDFCEIPVVVALHLEVEYFALGITSLGDQVLVEKSLQHSRQNCYHLISLAGTPTFGFEIKSKHVARITLFLCSNDVHDGTEVARVELSR